MFRNEAIIFLHICIWNLIMLFLEKEKEKVIAIYSTTAFQ